MQRRHQTKTRNLILMSGKYFWQLTVTNINRNTLFYGNEQKEFTENLEFSEQ